MQLRSYPKVYNLGHANVASLLDDTVVCEEKVDGSQFGFGVVDGKLCCRSRGAEIDVTAPPKLFAPAVETVKALYDDEKLVEGVTYRGEAFQKPKHNVLAYDRVPKGNVILFDVDRGMDDFMSPIGKKTVADLLGLECVPMLVWSSITSKDEILAMLERESILGGQKIEGVVIKAYGRFGKDGKTLMGKYVSEAFKESHNKDWKVRNPNRSDVIDKIVETLRSTARWEKAIQHLRDRGELTDSPKDIGPLFKEVNEDVMEEEREFMCAKLLEWGWRKGGIAKGVTRGLAEWYKQKLLEKQFADV
jgi:hypothetical protein